MCKHGEGVSALGKGDIKSVKASTLSGSETDIVRQYEADRRDRGEGGRLTFCPGGFII